MTIDEIIANMKVVQEYFEQETGGCVPSCIPEAIEYLEKIREEQND